MYMGVYKVNMGVYKCISGVYKVYIRCIWVVYKMYVTCIWVYISRASSVPVFPYLVCKCPIIPIIPSENKNRQVHELLLVECDKE